jgi:hypothetical protein
MVTALMTGWPGNVRTGRAGALVRLVQGNSALTPWNWLGSMARNPNSPFADPMRIDLPVDGLRAQLQVQRLGFDGVTVTKSHIVNIALAP